MHTLPIVKRPAAWKSKGRNVVVESAGNRLPQPSTPATTEFPTSMEQDGHDVVVQDASPVVMESLSLFG